MWFASIDCAMRALFTAVKYKRPSTEGVGSLDLLLGYGA